MTMVIKMMVIKLMLFYHGTSDYGVKDNYFNGGDNGDGEEDGDDGNKHRE